MICYLSCVFFYLRITFPRWRHFPPNTPCSFPRNDYI